MLIVLLVFFGVFFCRDVQVLAMQRLEFASRFAIYALLQIAGVVAAGWRTESFARTGVLVQLAELAIAAALARWASGQYSWVGWMLPSPAFILMLYGFSLIARHILHVDLYQALALATSAWLILLGVAGWLFGRTEATPEDRKFVSDLALMTSCTALVFFPLRLA